MIFVIYDGLRLLWRRPFSNSPTEYSVDCYLYGKKIELHFCNSILVVDRGIEPLCQD